MEGEADETVAFAVGAKYLYASLTGNHLRTTETLNNNASWNVTISESGVATIKANVSGQNWLRYNSTNNPPIFSCYNSGQSDVSIYKLQGTGSAPLPKLDAPSVTASLNDEENGINVSWNAVTNATSYVVTCTGQDDVELPGTTCVFEDLSSGDYTIVVTAKADGYRSAKSEAITVTVPSAGGGDEPEQPGAKKTYTLTISASDFNSTSYAANNNEKTSIATATDGSTLSVKWTSNQVMLGTGPNAGKMQWQKSKGYIYNSTDLGSIEAIEIASSAGTYTQNIGGSQQPTSKGDGGYFNIKIGGATGYSTKVTITFTK
jgi:hypothetical protein